MQNENKFGAEINFKHYGLVDLKHACDEAELNALEMSEKMMNWDSKQWAVFAYFDYDVNMIEDISDLDIGTDDENIGGRYLLVLTDDEADDAEDAELDSYLEEIIYSEIPEYLRRYFNDEEWKSDNSGCRGENLAHYDGQEREYRVDNEVIYIYRR